MLRIHLILKHMIRTGKKGSRESEYPLETLLIFFLNCSLLDIVQKNQKLVFKIREFLLLLYINLKWLAKFQIYRLHIRDSDWLNFIHFLRYKYKIKLVSVLRKRDDQALISISTILKYSAQVMYFFWSSCLGSTGSSTIVIFRFVAYLLNVIW